MRSLLFVSAAVAPVLAHQAVYELKLAGSCDNRLHLDGLSFFLQGTTVGGSPYWRAQVNSPPQAVFLYYDPDCDASKDGTSRWIVDTDQPSLTAGNDLDGDLKCRYVARINSADPTAPPVEGMWHMECGNGTAMEWRDHYLILLGKSTTVTSTSTEAGGLDAQRPWWDEDGDSEGNATLQDEASRPTPPTPTKEVEGGHGDMPHKMLRLQGACPYKGHLNGMTFVMLGRTANGAPYYRSSNGLEYLYYDEDCDGPGGSQASAKWILDQDAPNLQRLADLDGDRRCDYHARVPAWDGDRSTGPPQKAPWRMYCGPTAKWTDVIVSLRHVGAAGGNAHSGGDAGGGVDPATATTSLGAAPLASGIARAAAPWALIVATWAAVATLAL